MSIEIKGVVQSKPSPADNKRITFVLFCEEPTRSISCISSLRFDTAFAIRQGEKLTLFGAWATDPSTGQEACFIFDAASRMAKVA
jgi:hypothetical protein